MSKWHVGENPNLNTTQYNTLNQELIIHSKGSEYNHHHSFSFELFWVIDNESQ